MREHDYEYDYGRRPREGSEYARRARERYEGERDFGGREPFEAYERRGRERGYPAPGADPYGYGNRRGAQSDWPEPRSWHERDPWGRDQGPYESERQPYGYGGYEADDRLRSEPRSGVGFGGYEDFESRSQIDRPRSGVGYSGYRETRSQMPRERGWGGREGYGQSSHSDERDRPMAGQFRGRGPKGYQRSRERILDDVSERLADHPEIDASEMEVDVQADVVILRGSVYDRGQKRMAEDVAESVSGVRDVRNELDVEKGMLQELTDAVTGRSDEEERPADTRTTPRKASV
jgi:osmotically-inducible protein OsmY